MRIIMESPNKQCSLNPVTTWFIKRLCSCAVLLPTVATIWNASFTEGVLPVSQKHAIIRPRLKKSTLDHDLNSDRPISNLTFLSKTIEMVVATRFNEHADAHDLLLLRQSAYCAHHSTETALTDIHHRLVWNVDRGGHVSALVLLDLSSAFDTVDHAILLDMLKKRFGIGGIAFKGFRSHLSDRTQTFQMGLQNSKTLVVCCSVPQGSDLGVLKFVVYTEDLPAVIEQCAIEHHLYVDDTQVLDDPPITSVTASILNMDHCIDAVHTWYSSKHLQLNPTTIEIIWFMTRASLKCLQHTDISQHVGTVAIKPTRVVRDLGVLLELSMWQHIGKLTGLCYYHLRRLKKVQYILGPTITCRRVSAFVSSRPDYCNSILAGLPKSTIAHLQRIQNAAVRLVWGLGPCDHVTKSVCELHWLPIQFRIMYNLCLMMLNVHTGCSPGYIKKILTLMAGLPNRSRLR